MRTQPPVSIVTRSLTASTSAAKDEFTVLIAHEFFDALPIHIFEVREPRPLRACRDPTD